MIIFNHSVVEEFISGFYEFDGACKKNGDLWHWQILNFPITTILLGYPESISIWFKEIRRQF